MNRAYVIGIDGGGSETMGLLADLDGNIRARSVAGPSNFHTIGLTQAVAHVQQVVQSLYRAVDEDVASQCRTIALGLAGLGRVEDQEKVRFGLTEAGLSGDLILTHDAHIALLAGTGGEPGILLVSGTGSIAYAIGADQQAYRAGGWGPLLADEGSGYWIALAGLRAVMRGHDGRCESTRLTQVLLESLDLEAPEKLVRWIHDADRTQIARLAPFVFETAAIGDGVAQGILNQAAHELASLVQTVASNLPSDSGNRVVLSGGVLLHQPAFAATLGELLLSFRLEPLSTEPAWGAVLLALRETQQPT